MDRVAAAGEEVMLGPEWDEGACGLDGSPAKKSSYFNQSKKSTLRIRIIRFIYIDAVMN